MTVVLPAVPTHTPGPESEGPGWKIYHHTDGGFELAVWVAPGVRRKMRVPRQYDTPDVRARFAGGVSGTKGAAGELKRQYREQLKNPTVAAPKADATALTFGDVANLWASGELARKYPDQVKAKSEKVAGGDGSRLRLLTLSIGDVPLKAFTIDEAERAMRALPERATAPATRRGYAQLISRVLALAVYPLRIITASPIPKGFVPKLGAGKAKVYLYPAEDAQLMACGAVPLPSRILYGVLAREGMRAGEAIDLAWKHVDLARGLLRLDNNKTDDARAWTLDPGVVRALVAWRKLTPNPEDSSRVFVEDNGASFRGVHHATVFRQIHLKAAKIDRPELFERGKNRLPIRVHDLRATFVTLSLANGKTESWVSDRTGHKSTLMINRYRRTARQASELGLGALAPLDLAIPELAELAPPTPPTEGPTEGTPKKGVSGPVSAPEDVPAGSLAFTSGESSRELAEPESPNPLKSCLLSPLRIPFRQGAFGDSSGDRRVVRAAVEDSSLVPHPERSARVDPALVVGLSPRSGWRPAPMRSCAGSRPRRAGRAHAT